MSSTCSMCATNSPLCSGGITHWTAFHGCTSFFLARDEPSRTKWTLHTGVPPSCQPVNVMTTDHIPRVDHCSSKRSDALQHRRLLSSHTPAAVFFTSAPSTPFSTQRRLIRSIFFMLTRRTLDICSLVSRCV